ncbi:TATA-binding protein-associated factor 172-like isoform X2 [Eriocheir sinensis]|uniref:TATA-binding protein-associated factor 172-like isoform X2 n=1 Tax=Eriocheir sinensis TaxID=95602 RepID=UPI0021C66D4E|nr:TATA-binding protein-associated factor 172-like isoform X2 [Eriocheir sinensis]
MTLKYWALRSGVSAICVGSCGLTEIFCVFSNPEDPQGARQRFLQWRSSRRRNMSTRLDRLFVLLENGGSGVTRGAAAQQLGEVVRLHPQELSALLNRLHGLLLQKSWDVRMAAGLAVEASVSNVPPWDPAPTPSTGLLGEENSQSVPPRLTLRAFSINRVLERGAFLMAADERLFNTQDDNKSTDPSEQLVNQRLGLDFAAAVGVDIHGIVSKEDLKSAVAERENSSSGSGHNGQGKAHSLSQMVWRLVCLAAGLAGRTLTGLV